MPSLPPSSNFTGGSVTEGQFKTALTGLRDFLSGLLGTDGTPATALTALGAAFNAVVNKTAAYTVTVGDRGRLITASGAGGWTLSLPAAATAGAGFSVSVWNGTSGTVTIDPNGAELINADATRSLVAASGGTLVCTGTAWHFLPTERAVTTSATDATVGRLLKVGDFGLGGSLPNAPANISVDPTTFGSGSYAYATPASVGGPVDVTRATLVHTSRAGSIGMQIMIGDVPGTARNRIWVRAYVSGAWAEWSEVYSQKSVLGPVAQASGVPTGALIETANNANGRYSRWADGTQICWRGLTATTGAGSVWTVPAAFSAAPHVTGSAIATVLSSVQLDAAPSATAVTVSTRDKTDARRADVMHLIAIGRWF